VKGGMHYGAETVRGLDKIRARVKCGVRESANV